MQFFNLSFPSLPECPPVTQILLCVTFVHVHLSTTRDLINSVGSAETFPLLWISRETALLIDPKNSCSSSRQWVALVVGHELAPPVVWQLGHHGNQPFETENNLRHTHTHTHTVFKMLIIIGTELTWVMNKKNCSFKWNILKFVKKLQSTWKT